MRRLCVVLLASTVAGYAQDPARMDQVATALAANDKFMGSVLVARDGAVIFSHSYGWANVEWKIPNSDATKFQLGSVTSQFTAAAILLLEEQGRLMLGDPLSKFVPNAPEAWKPVTIQQLLAHTSGIPNFTALPEDGIHQRSPEGPAQTMMAQLGNRPLDFTPGEKFRFSSADYVMLGWIIKLASGQSYENFLHVYIFQRLGMNDSGYDSNLPIIPQRASGYLTGRPGLVNAPLVDVHVPGVAGALYSTTGDLLRWTQGLFGGKLLKPISLEKMTTPVKGEYAFGLSVTMINGRKVFTDDGSIDGLNSNVTYDGFNSHLAYFPESKTTVVVLANVNGLVFSELGHELAALAFGETVTLPAERKHTAISLPTATLSAYVGTYEIRQRLDLTITLEDGKLTSQLSGQAKNPLFAETETTFFLQAPDAQIEFFKDASGAVTHLVLHQRGGYLGDRDFTAIRKL